MDWSQFLGKFNQETIRVHRKDLDLKPSSSVKVFELNKHRTVHDMQTLLKEFSVQANFGGHFGFNWDALIDCLTEPDFPGVESVVFLFYHYRDFENAAEMDFNSFLDVFGSAANRAKYELDEYRLIVVLVDD